MVFSDLDGTLLEHETYSFEAARPALERLKVCGIPLVLTTSKTRAEVEHWRERLGNRDPFIVENGAAVFIPNGYFPGKPRGTVDRGDYAVIEFGDRYADLVEALRRASQESGCPVIGFHAMTVAQTREATGLDSAQAALAAQREYDEPFTILDTGRAPDLLRAIERQGKRWTRGGRFHHITGQNDKAGAVRLLAELYRETHGQVRAIGLGDGLNDAEFLNAVDTPVLVRSHSAVELQAAVPRGRITRVPGPAGWNEAILEMVP